MTTLRASFMFVIVCLTLVGVGATAAPAAAQGGTVQRITLNGMWVDITWSATASVHAGGILSFTADLVPHDSSLPLIEGRLTLDLTRLGWPRTVSLSERYGDELVEFYSPVSVYAPPGDILLRVTASADLGRGGTFELPLRILPPVDADADTLPDVWETQLGLSTEIASGIDGPDGDPDGDGRSNRDEYQWRSHPRGLYTRYFPEGVSGNFFADFLDAQPLLSGSVSRLLVRTLDGDGLAVAYTMRYGATGSFDVATLSDSSRTAGGSHAAIVESDVPFSATRSTTWPTYASGYALAYGSHGSEGTPTLSTRWLFAEGVKGPFDTYLALLNPSSTETATVTINYVGTDGVTPIVRQHTIGPERRATIWVNADADGLASTDVAFIVDSSLPIAAERSVYLSTGGQFWGAGTSSVGAPAASATWYFAEGLVNPIFDTYLLLLNPGDTTAEVAIEVLRADGLPPLVIERTLRPRTRASVHLNDAHPALAGSTSFGLAVRSTNAVPIVAERTMWWDDPVRGTIWVEGHTSVGAPEPATRWSAGPQWLFGAGAAASAYLLIANPGDTIATVRVSKPQMFGATPEQTVTVPPRARITLDLAAGFPPDLFVPVSPVLVESLGPSAAPIVVERSVYANTLDAIWTLGSNTLLTPIP